MPLSFLDIIFGIAQAALKVFLLTWWFVVPIVLFFTALDFWKSYIFISYVKSIKWALLKVKTPKDVLKTPKAMEQVFAAAHASYSFGIKFFDGFFKGKVEDWHSFEIVGDATGVYFYIRTPASMRNTIESAIYSQYPEAEIQLVDDYTDDLPSILPNDTYDVFGTEFKLAKDSAYPIQTYPYFDAIEAEEKIDTVATITEVMSRLKGGERIWLQLVIKPIGDDWKKKSEAERDKLAGRKADVKMGFADKFGEFIINLIKAPFVIPEWADEKKSEKPTLGVLTKGEQEVIQAIEKKAAKIGFDGILRFVYVDEKASFSRDNIAAVMGALRQVNTLNLNSIAPNLDTMTIPRPPLMWLFKKRRVYLKKRDIFDFYCQRRTSKKSSVFNTEELATLYHFPSQVVSAPALRPIEFKKGAPPSNLPFE